MDGSLARCISRSRRRRRRARLCRSRRASSGCACGCPSRSTTSICGCSRTAPAGPSSIAAMRCGDPRRLGTHLRRRPRRPAGQPDHRHALPPRPYRACRLARRALGAPLWTTEKEWLHARMMAADGGDVVRAAPRLRPPRRARRRSRANVFAERQGNYRRGVPSVPPALSPHRRGHGDRDRRAGVAGHHRRGPCARTRLPLLRRNRRA